MIEYGAYKDIQEIIKLGKEIEVIYGCEFELEINKNGSLSLIDTQDVNLGDIENEEFLDYEQVLERLECSYLYDYGYLKDIE